MLGIQYLKTDPTQFVIHYQGGRKLRSGTGLAFFYLRAAASISVVPLGSTDVPFIFNEMTADFQPVTIQGQLIYRINNPERVAALLNYTIDSRPDRYVSEDPEKLSQRLVNLVQSLVRAEILTLPLREAIRSSMEVGVKVFVEDLLTGETRHTSSAYLTFVALDAEGKRVPIPQAIPETEDEKRRFEDAGKRREYRLELREGAKKGI